MSVNRWLDSEISSGVSIKKMQSLVYEKDESDGLLLDKADRADVYTKADVDTLVYESKIENVSVYTGSAQYHPPLLSEQNVEVRIPTKDGVFKATSSSSSDEDSEGPDKAFDHSLSSYWKTKDDVYRTSEPLGEYRGDKQHHAGSLVGEWLGIELPYRVHINHFEIANRWNSDAPSTFQIFGTNNDVDWFLLVYQDGITWPSDMSKEFVPQSNNDVPYKKFVLVIHKTNGRDISSIAKFVIHGGS
jgi:hypothetical protein